jgi:hypothetical protein
MKTNYQVVWAIFLLILALPFLYGCPKRGSQITLRVTDCQKDSIRIVFSDSSIVMSAPHKIVIAKVSIYCGSQVIQGAEVMVDFPFLSTSSFTPFKNETDQNGQIFINQPMLSDPSGQNLEIKIIGNDGEKAVTMTIPPIPSQ